MLFINLILNFALAANMTAHTGQIYSATVVDGSCFINQDFLQKKARDKVLKKVGEGQVRVSEWNERLEIIKSPYTYAPCLSVRSASAIFAPRESLNKPITIAVYGKYETDSLYSNDDGWELAIDNAKKRAQRYCQDVNLIDVISEKRTNVVGPPRRNSFERYVVKAKFSCINNYDDCEVQSPFCENNCCD